MYNYWEAEMEFGLNPETGRPYADYDTNQDDPDRYTTQGHYAVNYDKMTSKFIYAEAAQGIANIIAALQIHANKK